MTVNWMEELGWKLHSVSTALTYIQNSADDQGELMKDTYVFHRAAEGKVQVQEQGEEEQL